MKSIKARKGKTERESRSWAQGDSTENHVQRDGKGLSTLHLNCGVVTQLYTNDKIYEIEHLKLVNFIL